ncbi:MAG TPA: helix-turn-helix transcriptional regulator [Candidatus Kapabacteria bacterium]|nr:helix-turn-helix transcriptional regulator [Candidatus Kapabacteria bacterium]
MEKTRRRDQPLIEEIKTFCGQYLAGMLLFRQMTQLDLVEKMTEKGPSSAVSTSTMSRWLRGHTLPTRSDLRHLAEALNIPYDALWCTWVLDYRVYCGIEKGFPYEAVRILIERATIPPVTTIPEYSVPHIFMKCYNPHLTNVKGEERYVATDMLAIILSPLEAVSISFPGTDWWQEYRES